MKPYAIYPSETSYSKDRITGITVRRLTDFRGHSHHPYFTDDGWYDNDRRMLFASDRGNASNLFSVDIESGEISQLTDFGPEKGRGMSCPMHVNHQRNEVYYQYNRCVYAMNLGTLETRPLYIVPQGFNFGGARPTGDGKAVVGALSQDLSATIKANLSASYIGFREIHDAKPESRIIRIDLDDGAVDTVWEEKRWITHVNPSLAKGNLLTFCHEGPWNIVDHRMWVLDMDTGNALKLRERRYEDERIGHEYWFADGIHIGYQAHRRDESGDLVSFFGFIKYDGTGETEAPCKVMKSGPDHIHSIGFDFIVSDTGKSIKGYKYNGTSFDGPRVITMHDGSFDWGSHHPHPAMTRDGKHVVYNSNSAGYCNIYMVAIPDDFAALPEVE